MKHILIVDDDQDHRLILRSMLENFGYDCEEAEDGMVALEILSKGQVDLVLTDLRMPRMNGLQLVQHVTDESRFEAIPIILVTSQASDSIPLLGSKRNLVAILSKPYEWKRLLAAVASATENVQSEISLAG